MLEERYVEIKATKVRNFTNSNCVTCAKFPVCFSIRFNKLLLAFQQFSCFSNVVPSLFAPPENVSLASLPLCSHSSSDILRPTAALAEGVCFEEAVQLRLPVCFVTHTKINRCLMGFVQITESTYWEAAGLTHTDASMSVCRAQCWMCSSANTYYMHIFLIYQWRFYLIKLRFNEILL